MAVLTLIVLTRGVFLHALPGPDATPAAPAADSRTGAAFYTVLPDTILRVRLNGRLSSATARVGESFQATVTKAVSAGGVVLVPAGSIVDGRVATVERAQPGLRLGVLGLHFTTLRTPNGATYPIDGSLTSFSGETYEFDSSGKARGRAVKRRDTVFVGVPTAVLTRTGALTQAGAATAEVPYVGPVIAAVLAAVAAILILVGSMLAKAKEDEAAAKEKKPGATRYRTPSSGVATISVQDVRADVELGPGTQFGVLLGRELALRK